MSWIEKKYINFVKPYLRNFSWKSDHLANCSCPICGDSKTNRLKARFFFMEEKGTYKCYCHNCHYSASFKFFLKEFNEAMFDDMRLETVADKFIGAEKPKEETKFVPAKPLFLVDHTKKLTKLNKLGHNHKALQYLRGRKIPETKYKNMYYTDNFGGWVNTYLPGKLADREEEPRIVFPLYDRTGHFFGCTGRSLDPNEESHRRYITIIVDSDQSKVYGMHSVATERKYYATEGIFDSFFLENSVAMLGTSLSKCNLDLTNAVFIYDNEPRNKDVMRQVENVAIAGHKIFIWPTTIKQKDINECVLAGISNMQEIIDQNTFQGLEAELELKKWRKC